MILFKGQIESITHVDFTDFSVHLTFLLYTSLVPDGWVVFLTTMQYVVMYFSFYGQLSSLVRAVYVLVH